MKRRIGLLTLIFVVGLTARALMAPQPGPDLSAFLRSMYDARAAALITGQTAAAIPSFYASEATGALAHERGRIAYLQSWAAARGLKVVQAQTLLTNLRVRESGDTATVSLIGRTAIDYQYEENGPVNRMGIGSWHWLQLVRRDGAWKVQKEYYLDALGDEWTEPYSMAVIPAPGPAPGTPAAKGKVDRAGAVAYAEKYCGAAWGCGNKSDYNERYRSYRHQGGDCANFASQVLTQGGKIRPDFVWRAEGNPAKGSACWVNAAAFTRHMLYSGRARLLAKGTYPKVAKALAHLEPGDIIAYQRKGGITHVSVVTGKDSAGVPIVAAHTTDRFRNPWDLGWDKSTVFWLLHLND